MGECGGPEGGRHRTGAVWGGPGHQRKVEVVKTTGFPGWDPPRATLCPVALPPPDFAHGVQSPGESLSFFALSSRRHFPLHRKFFLSLGFRDPPVSVRPKGLSGELLTSLQP